MQCCHPLALRRSQPAYWVVLQSINGAGHALCRYQFTSKLESMFTDIKTSRDAMQSFKQHQANAASTSGAADDIDLAVQVRCPPHRLQSFCVPGAWPRTMWQTDKHTDRQTHSESCTSRGASPASGHNAVRAASALPQTLTCPPTQVLTTGSWPTQTAAKCNLPRELEQCCKSFQDYYLKAHSGRKLSWQTNMGNADLKASACRG